MLLSRASFLAVAAFQVAAGISNDFEAAGKVMPTFTSGDSPSKLGNTCQKAEDIGGAGPYPI